LATDSAGSSRLSKLLQALAMARASCLKNGSTYEVTKRRVEVVRRSCVRASIDRLHRIAMSPDTEHEQVESNHYT